MKWLKEEEQDEVFLYSQPDRHRHNIAFRLSWMRRRYEYPAISTHSQKQEVNHLTLILTTEHLQKLTAFPLEHYYAARNLLTAIGLKLAMLSLIDQSLLDYIVEYPEEADNIRLTLEALPSFCWNQRNIRALYNTPNAQSLRHVILTLTQKQSLPTDQAQVLFLYDKKINAIARALQHADALHLSLSPPEIINALLPHLALDTIETVAFTLDELAVTNRLTAYRYHTALNDPEQIPPLSEFPKNKQQLINPPEYIQRYLSRLWSKKSEQPTHKPPNKEMPPCLPCINPAFQEKIQSDASTAVKSNPILAYRDSHQNNVAHYLLLYAKKHPLTCSIVNCFPNPEIQELFLKLNIFNESPLDWAQKDCPSLAKQMLELIPFSQLLAYYAQRKSNVLDLSHTVIRDSEIRTLIYHLLQKSPSNQVSLNLSHAEIISPALETFFRFLKVKKYPLKELNLKAVKIDQENLALLAEWLAEDSSLKALSLKDHWLISSDSERLSTALYERQKSLPHFNTEYAQYDIEDLHKLYRAWHYNQRYSHFLEGKGPINPITGIYFQFIKELSRYLKKRNPVAIDAQMLLQLFHKQFSSQLLESVEHPFANDLREKLEKKLEFLSQEKFCFNPYFSIILNAYQTLSSQTSSDQTDYILKIAPNNIFPFLQAITDPNGVLIQEGEPLIKRVIFSDTLRGHHLIRLFHTIRKHRPLEKIIWDLTAIPLTTYTQKTKKAIKACLQSAVLINPKRDEKNDNRSLKFHNDIDHIKIHGVTIGDWLQSAWARTELLTNPPQDPEQYNELLKNALRFFVFSDDVRQEPKAYFQFLKIICESPQWKEIEQGKKNAAIKKIQANLIAAQVVSTPFLNAEPQDAIEKLKDFVNHKFSHIAVGTTSVGLTVATAVAAPPVAVAGMAAAGITAVAVTAVPSIADKVTDAAELVEPIKRILEYIKTGAEATHAVSQLQMGHGNPQLPAMLQRALRRFDTSTTIKNMNEALPQEISELSNRAVLEHILDRVALFAPDYPYLRHEFVASRLIEYLKQGYFLPKDVKSINQFTDKLIFLLTYDITPSTQQKSRKNTASFSALIPSGPRIALLDNQEIIWTLDPENITDAVGTLEVKKEGGGIKKINVNSTDYHSPALQRATQPEVELLKDLLSKDWDAGDAKNIMKPPDIRAVIRPRSISASDPKEIFKALQNTTIENSTLMLDREQLKQELADNINQLHAYPLPEYVSLSDTVKQLAEIIDRLEKGQLSLADAIASTKQETNVALKILDTLKSDFEEALKSKADKTEIEKALERLTDLEKNQEKQDAEIKEQTTKIEKQDTEIKEQATKIKNQNTLIEEIFSEMTPEQKQRIISSSSLPESERERLSKYLPKPALANQAMDVARVDQVQALAQADAIKANPLDQNENDPIAQAVVQALLCHVEANINACPNNRRGPEPDSDAPGPSSGETTSGISMRTAIQSGVSQQSTETQQSNPSGSTQGAQQMSRAVTQEKQNLSTELFDFLKFHYNISRDNQDILIAFWDISLNHLSNSITEVLRNAEFNKTDFYTGFFVGTPLLADKIKDSPTLLVLSHSHKKGKHRVHVAMITSWRLKNLLTPKTLQPFIKQAFSEYYSNEDLKIQYHPVPLKKSANPQMQLLSAAEWLMEKRDYPHADFEKCLWFLEETVQYEAQYTERRQRQILENPANAIRNMANQHLYHLDLLLKKDPGDFFERKNQSALKKIIESGRYAQLNPNTPSGRAHSIGDTVEKNEASLFKAIKTYAEQEESRRQLEEIESTKKSVMQSTASKKAADNPLFALGFLMISMTETSAVTEQYRRAKTYADYDAHEHYMAERQQSRICVFAYSAEAVPPVLGMLAVSSIKKTSNALAPTTDYCSQNNLSRTNSTSRMNSYSQDIFSLQRKNSNLSLASIAGDDAREFKHSPLQRSASSESIAVNNPSRWLSSESQIRKYARETVREVSRQAFLTVSRPAADQEINRMRSMIEA